MELFSSNDMDYIRQRGNNPKLVTTQFENYYHGITFAKLDRIATINDGIIRIDTRAISSLNNHYDRLSKNKKIVKFIPASGAATRMFKDLFEALSMDENQYSSKVLLFFEQLSKYAFYKDLITISNTNNKQEILKILLNDS